MSKSFFAAFSFITIASTSLLAQNQQQPAVGFSGTIEAQGGIGSANPWDGQIDLQYRNKQVFVHPFAGITGISRFSSKQDEELNLHYSSGSYFESDITTEQKGTLLQYGTDLGFYFSPKSTLKAGIKVSQDDLKCYGDGHIYVYDLLEYHYEIYGPKQDRKEIHTTASFEQVLNRQHKLTFNYSHDQSEIRKTQNKVYGRSVNYIPNGVREDAYAYRDNADIDIYNLGAEWSYQSKHRWSIKSGVNYLSRKIDSECQEAYVDDKNLLTTDWITLYVNNPDRDISYGSSNLTHEIQTLAATSDFSLPIQRSPFGLPWHVALHLEYDFTTMTGSWIDKKTLHDFVPRAIITMPLNSTQKLTASYVRRIIRPEWEMLNPFSFYDKFTTSYGNMELEGIHLNVASLVYRKQFAAGNFTTTASHIFTKDGFNAIWMLKGNKRIYTWGNQGERTAWSVAPALQISPNQLLTLNAKATLLWDKRIAEAISMEKEHWGITAETSALIKLPHEMSLDLHGLYSEGNTIDLYSHASRSFKVGSVFGMPIGSYTQFNLRFDCYEYARTIVTQGAYTGRSFCRPGNNFEASAQVIITL